MGFNMNNSIIKALAFTGTGLSLSLGAHAATEIKFGGYIKADAIFINEEYGQSGSGVFRDILVPGAIGVDSSKDSSSYLHAHAKESRFYLKTLSELNGKSLTSHIELDFIASGQGNERISNSYSPRLRHAYVQYGNWLAGQTWSTFMNVGALGESLDFAGGGYASARVFVRQPMLRYSNKGLTIALENPEATLTQQDGSRLVGDDSILPDIIVKKSFKTDLGSFSAAAMVREISYDDNNGNDDSAIGGALHLSGKIHLAGKDDLRFSAFAGNALGRYNALNAFNAAQIDANGDVELVNQVGGYVAYRHFWGDSNYRSTFTYGATSGDYDTAALATTAVNKSVQSASINLLYSPVPQLTYGGELIFAQRELENGQQGDQQRLQFSVKYGF